MSRDVHEEPSLDQVAAVLKLMREKEVSRDGLAKVLSSGILADVLDDEADLKDRYEVRTALCLKNFTLFQEVFRVTVGDPRSIAIAHIANYPERWENERELAQRAEEKREASRGVYECIYIRAALKSTTYDELDRLTQRWQKEGRWKKANEAHLSACVAAYIQDYRLPSGHILAPGGTAQKDYAATTYPVFSNSHGGMVSPSRNVWRYKVTAPLEGIYVLFVRKVE